MAKVKPPVHALVCAEMANFLSCDLPQNPHMNSRTRPENGGHICVDHSLNRFILLSARALGDLRFRRTAKQ